MVLESRFLGGPGGSGGGQFQGKERYLSKTSFVPLLVMIFVTQKVRAIVKIPKFAFYEPPYCTMNTCYTGDRFDS